MKGDATVKRRDALHLLSAGASRAVASACTELFCGAPFSSEILVIFGFEHGVLYAALLEKSCLLSQ